MTTSLFAGLSAFGLQARDSSAEQKTPEVTPLSVADAIATMSLNHMSAVDLSPDGKWVAYTVSDPRRKRSSLNPQHRVYGPTGVPLFFDGCEVWVTNILDRRSIKVGGGKGASCSPVWSPDGKRLAFFSDREGGTQIWVWERETGTLRNPCIGFARPYAVCGPKWTPDGSKLLVKILPEGMTLEQAADLGVMPQASHHAEQDIGPGSTVTVYSSLIRRPSNITGQHLSDSFADVFLGDLALIDVASGKMERIVSGDRCHWFSLSPDGACIAYTRPRGYASMERGLQYYYDLVVVEVENGPARVVAPMAQGAAYTVSWSPSSKLLAFTTSGDQARGDCYTVPADGSESPRRVTPGSHPGFGHEFRAPLWDLDGQSIYLFSSASQTGLWKVSVAEGTAREVTRIPGRTIREVISAGVNSNTFWSLDRGRSLVVMTRNEKTKDSGFYKVDLTSGAYTRLLEEHKAYGGGIGGEPILAIDASRDGNRIIYSAESARQSEDFWMIDSQFKTNQRVTDINPQLGRYVTGESRIVEWRGGDGETLQGALLLPAGHENGRRYPLIVFQYPTSKLSRFVNNYGVSRYNAPTENWQLMATRGYAVFLPDIPVNEDGAVEMQDLPKKVMPGVDKVIEMGIADPDRLGVIGHSFGGYGVLSLIVQTTRFKAAVSRAPGYADHFLQYGNLDELGDSIYVGLIEQMRKGTPWERRAQYIENSPFFYLDRVRTPLLIIQGSSDSATVAAQSDLLFVGLRRLGREVEYAKYQGEDHAEEFWSHANQSDYFNRVIRWFDSKLQRGR